MFKCLRDHSIPLLWSSHGDQAPPHTGSSAETALGIGIGMIPVIHEESEEASDTLLAIDATSSISGLSTLPGNFGHRFRSPRSWAFTQGELRAGENNLHPLQVGPCSYACPRRVSPPPSTGSTLRTRIFGDPTATVGEAHTHGHLPKANLRRGRPTLPLTIPVGQTSRHCSTVGVVSHAIQPAKTGFQHGHRHLRESDGR
jgi:hypothetical protein